MMMRPKILCVVALTTFLLALVSSRVQASGQQSENIRFLYNDDDEELSGTLPLLSVPLEQYPAPAPREWGERSPSAVSRGYEGLWQVSNDGNGNGNQPMLYLISLDKSGKYMHEMFGTNDPVLATWYTGDLRILPKGSERVRYDHAGFAQLYTKEILAKVVEGKVVSVQKIEATEEEIQAKEPVGNTIRKRIDKGITDVGWNGEVGL